MKNINTLGSVFLVFLLLVFVLSLALPCSAQFLPYPFFPSINPFLPSIFSPYSFPLAPPVTLYSAAAFSPVTALPSIYPRGAAATLIVVPPPAPTVTAYAPLGTLNLTPSTLVFLILLFTLEE